MNTDLLRKVADRIELEDRFDIRNWACKLGDDSNPTADEVLNDCGTTACIGGYVNALAGRCDLGDWSAAATNLGLNSNQGANLFFISGETTVWRRNAAAWGIEDDDLSQPNDSWVDPVKITAPLAAKVLRMIADGEVTL